MEQTGFNIKNLMLSLAVVLLVMLIISLTAYILNHSNLQTPSKPPIQLDSNVTPKPQSQSSSGSTLDNQIVKNSDEKGDETWSDKTSSNSTLKKLVYKMGTNDYQYNLSGDLVQVLLSPDFSGLYSQKDKITIISKQGFLRRIDDSTMHTYFLVSGTSTDSLTYLVNPNNYSYSIVKNNSDIEPAFSFLNTTFERFGIVNKIYNEIKGNEFEKDNYKSIQGDIWDIRIKFSDEKTSTYLIKLNEDSLIENIGREVDGVRYTINVNYQNIEVDQNNLSIPSTYKEVPISKLSE